jgi:hypothetical protein
MNRSTDHSKPLIFRAGGTATCVHEGAECLVFDCSLAWLAGPEWQGLAHGAALARGENPLQTPAAHHPPRYLKLPPLLLEADIRRRDLSLEIAGMFHQAPPCVQAKPNPSP